VKGTRLLGPFDLFLQARDRSLLVGDPARAKVVWPVLGRPGVVLLDGEIAGTWRPRWSAAKRSAVTDQAERLAAYRQVPLSGADFSR
jgi:hypothetical protein